MKHYLITGGTGFIGSALARALVQRGDRVRTLDNDWRGSRRRLADLRDAVECLTGDVRDPELVHQAVRGADAVCHLAAINGTEHFYQRPHDVLDVSVRGMLNVIDACRAHGVGELLVVSSSEVYQVPPIIPTPEEVPLVIPDPHNPRYSYAGGKLISELLALHFGKAYFQRVLIVRPHNVYGPDMGQEHAIPQFALRMRSLVNGSPVVRFPIQGSGEETRAFLYIDDFITGLLHVMERGEHLGIYHVGSEEEIPLRRLAEEVGRVFGCRVEIVPGPLREGSTPRRCPDIGKLKALGFEPRVPLAEGLARTMKWYVQQWAEACP